MNNSFNLVDEPWILLKNSSRISLLDLFNTDSGQNLQLGGNALEIISVLKLLQAISFAACQLFEDEYDDLDIEQFAARCSEYLSTHSHQFDLYDPERPFLQFPQLKDVDAAPFSSITPHQVTANANKTALNTFQFQLTDIDHPERAYMLLQQLGFAFGGKGVNTSVCLSDTHSKSKTGSFGPSLGYFGFLHSYIFGSNVIETLFINLLTIDEVDSLVQFPKGIGIAPWELMPESENCETAINLTNSLMGRLIPLNRFCLLKANGICVIEGIQYLTHKSGVVDLSATLIADKEYKAIWTNTEKSGWREAESILSFLNDGGSNKTNLQVKFALDHAQSHGIDHIHLVSLGLAVSYQSGEQYISGTNDYVYSELKLNARQLNSLFYGHLKQEWADLNKCAFKLSTAISNFYRDQYAKNQSSAKPPPIVSGKTSKNMTAFWQKLDAHANQFPKVCEAALTGDTGPRTKLRTTIRDLAHAIYAELKPLHSKSLDAWVKNKPHLNFYLEDKNNG